MTVSATLSTGDRIDLLICNISETGLLVESAAPIAAAEYLDIDLPHVGTVSVQIIWASGQFSGCQFDAPIASSLLSAIRLQRPQYSAPLTKRTPEKLPTNFGKRLQRIRREKGLSQQDLAAGLGVSAPSISGWEKGRTNPKSCRLTTLASLLGVTPTDLIDDDRMPYVGIENAVDRSRDEIARLLGTSIDKVRIIVEL